LAILIWDFDETLAYRDGKWTKTMHDLFHKNGYTQYTEEGIGPYFKVGLPWHRYEEAHEDYFTSADWWGHVTKVIRDKIIALGIDFPEADILAKQYREAYLDPSKWHLYEDTMATLIESKKRGHTNVILSNHVPELQELVSMLGLDDHVDQVFNSALIGYEKPNPALYRKVLDSLGTDSEIYMIGDSYKADVLGAQNVGINAIWVRQENTKDFECHAVTLKDVWQYIGGSSIESNSVEEENQGTKETGNTDPRG
jgi:putative hydrolase of the HAD superfamily